MSTPTRDTPQNIESTQSAGSTSLRARFGLATKSTLKRKFDELTVSPEPIETPLRLAQPTTQTTSLLTTDVPTVDTSASVKAIVGKHPLGFNALAPLPFNVRQVRPANDASHKKLTNGEHTIAKSANGLHTNQPDIRQRTTPAKTSSRYSLPANHSQTRRASTAKHSDRQHLRNSDHNELRKTVLQADDRFRVPAQSSAPGSTARTAYTASSPGSSRSGSQKQVPCGGCNDKGVYAMKQPMVDCATCWRRYHKRCAPTCSPEEMERRSKKQLPLTIGDPGWICRICLQKNRMPKAGLLVLAEESQNGDKALQVDGHSSPEQKPLQRPLKRSFEVEDVVESIEPMPIPMHDGANDTPPPAKKVRLNSHENNTIWINHKGNNGPDELLESLLKGVRPSVLDVENAANASAKRTGDPSALTRPTDGVSSTDGPEEVAIAESVAPAPEETGAAFQGIDIGYNARRRTESVVGEAIGDTLLDPYAGCECTNNGERPTSAGAQKESSKPSTVPLSDPINKESLSNHTSQHEPITETPNGVQPNDADKGVQHQPGPDRARLMLDGMDSSHDTENSQDQVHATSSQLTGSSQNGNSSHDTGQNNKQKESSSAQVFSQDMCSRASVIDSIVTASLADAPKVAAMEPAISSKTSTQPAGAAVEHPLPPRSIEDQQQAQHSGNRGSQAQNGSASTPNATSVIGRYVVTPQKQKSFLHGSHTRQSLPNSASGLAFCKRCGQPVLKTTASTTVICTDCKRATLNSPSNGALDSHKQRSDRHKQPQITPTAQPAEQSSHMSTPQLVKTPHHTSKTQLVKLRFAQRKLGLEDYEREFGSAEKHDNNAIVKLIEMAFAATPGRQLTCKAITDWVSATIPTYKRHSGWEGRVAALLKAHKVDGGTNSRELWKQLPLNKDVSLWLLKDQTGAGLHRWDPLTLRCIPPTTRTLLSVIRAQSAPNKDKSNVADGVFEQTRVPTTPLFEKSNTSRMSVSKPTSRPLSPSSDESADAIMHDKDIAFADREEWKTEKHSSKVQTKPKRIDQHEDALIARCLKHHTFESGPNMPSTDPVVKPLPRSRRKALINRPGYLSRLEQPQPFRRGLSPDPAASAKPISLGSSIYAHDPLKGVQLSQEEQVPQEVRTFDDLDDLFEIPRDAVMSISADDNALEWRMPAREGVRRTRPQILGRVGWWMDKED